MNDSSVPAAGPHGVARGATRPRSTRVPTRICSGCTSAMDASRVCVVERIGCVRRIELADWRREIVEQHPGRFLRGLFHSDGCRVTDWTGRTVAGAPKRYEYPRRRSDAKP